MDHLIICDGNRLTGGYRINCFIVEGSVNMPIEQDKTRKSPVSPGSDDRQRLPCRGCLPDCANYKRCQGLLWRLPASAP